MAPAAISARCMCQWPSLRWTRSCLLPIFRTREAGQPLLGGQVDFLSTGPSTVIQHVKAGKVRLLAHWGDKPLSAFPELPSLRDRGINVSYVQWAGLFALKNTPPQAVEKLERSIDEIAQSNPQFKAQIAGTGSPLDYQSAQEFAAFWQQDIQNMKALSRNLTAPK